MEFGKLKSVDAVDFSIPIDDPANGRRLTLGSPSSLSIFFGTPAWSHREWIGKIYPPGTKTEDFLRFYSRYFSCIELNTTHYRIPSAEQARKWKSKVDGNFLFNPKLYQGISHERGGLRNTSLLAEWLRFLNEMQGHLGPCFLQLPPHFDYGAKAELFDFLKEWPREFELALEFRHPSWFEGRRILPALADYLHSRGMGLVITDVAGRRDVLHTSLSAEFSLLRFIGNNLHPTDFERAAAWSRRIKQWEEAGLRRLFLFIHEPDDISAPEMSRAFLAELRNVGAWALRDFPDFASQLALDVT
jgi:uncharacterized protein YecE (DUF72 family)